MPFGELPEQPAGRDKVAERSRIRHAHSGISRRKCKHHKERARLEKDTAAWLKHYLADSYPLPFGQVHLDIIKGAEGTIGRGGKIVTVAPRGTGKTSVLWGVSLKVGLSGGISFPVYLPWKASDRRKALRFWKNALCFNKRLLDDYPEFCAPFAKSQGSSQKCATFWWKDTGNPCGAELRVSDGMIVFPDGRGVIGSETINGNPRGLNHATEDGRILRPDLAFIDDAQSKEVAKSPSQTAATCDLIDTDIAGMAGPAVRMPIFLSGTVTRRGDVMTHYLECKDWEAVRVGQIIKWPDNMDLWKPFGEAICEKREAEALAYYMEHREDLCKGMAVSWEHRFDCKRGEPDAFYSAMRDYFFMGEAAFMAERQGEPLEAITSEYELTAEMVMAHAINMPRLHLPSNSTVFVGHCDINKSRGGLHFCLAAFTQNASGHCPLYGHYPDQGNLWPDDASIQVIRRSIYEGLKIVCDRIKATGFMQNERMIQPSLLLIDASYEPEPVHAFSAWANQSRSYAFKVWPLIGRAAHRYFYRKESLIGRAFEGIHFQRAQYDQAKQYFMANACLWRETSQRAFLSAPGTPGGFTLHESPTDKHREFARQICAEKLVDKKEAAGKLQYWWQHAPGAQWDWGDALAGCWAAASVCGIAPGGATGKPRTPARETRTCKIQIAKP